MKNEIIQKALELGFDQCRITSADPPQHTREFEAWINAGRHGEMGWIERNAPKRTRPDLVLPGARSAIVLATSYHHPHHTTPIPGHQGAVARYARFEDYHEILAGPLQTLTDFVNLIGGTETRSLWYVDTGPILERDLAQRAGIGFAGKHTNLISRQLGNWFFLSEILTTLPLSPDAPEPNRCGSCSRCIQACPTNAITAPFELDARRCISYLTIELKGAIPEELRPAMGNRIYGCDDCLAACPWNRFAKAGRLMKLHQRQDLETPELLKLLTMDDAAFKQHFKGTPVLRTKRRGLLRNVCVALGNTAGAEALPALGRATLDKEPLIVEHARWAIGEIERREKATSTPECP